MKSIMLALFLSASAPSLAHAQGQAEALADEKSAIRDRIKIERIRDKEAIEVAPAGRPWDKDANGKRPWDSVGSRPKSPPDKP
jgi:hypothetical protein